MHLPRVLPPHHAAALRTWAETSAQKFDRRIDAEHYRLAPATLGLAAPTRRWLHQDLAHWIGHFVHLTGAQSLRLVLGPVRGDQCRRFHADYVRHRLLCCYVGPGTEWLPEHAVRRSALGKPSSDPHDTNADIVRDASAIVRAAAGDVVVMKGAGHPRSHGAVHRSPPIEGTGQVRLLLALSTIDGIE